MVTPIAGERTQAQQRRPRSVAVHVENQTTRSPSAAAPRQRLPSRVSWLTTYPSPELSRFAGRRGSPGTGELSWSRRTLLSLQAEHWSWLARAQSIPPSPIDLLSHSMYL